MNILCFHKHQKLALNLVLCLLLSSCKTHHRKDNNDLAAENAALTSSQPVAGLNLSTNPITEIEPSLSFSYTNYDYSPDKNEFTVDELLNQNIYFYTANFQREDSKESFPASLLDTFHAQGILQVDISKEGYVINRSDGKKIDKACYSFAIDSDRDALLISKKVFDLSDIDAIAAGNLCLDANSRIISVDNKNTQLAVVDARFEIKDNFFLFLNKKGFSTNIQVLLPDISDISDNSNAQTTLELARMPARFPKMMQKKEVPIKEVPKPLRIPREPPPRPYAHIPHNSPVVKPQHPIDLHPELRGRFPDATDVKVLGIGGFGKVFQICNPSGCMALKIPKEVNEHTLKAGEIENSVHRALYSEINKRTRGGGGLYVIPPLNIPNLRPGEIAMPVAETIEQAVRGGRLSFEQFVRQSSEAIASMKAAGFQHNDIKLDNFLFHNGRVKLTDFGAVTESNNARFQNRNLYIQTQGYVPPEGVYSHLRDEFALGVASVDFYQRLQRRSFYNCATRECWVVRSLADPQVRTRVSANQAIRDLNQQRIIPPYAPPVQRAPNNRLQAGLPIQRPQAQANVFRYTNDNHYAVDNYGNWFYRAVDGRYYPYRNY